MEFDINIHTDLTGKIVIEDCSLEYDQYIPENKNDYKYGYYKYSDCKTINVITKVTLENRTLVDVLYHNHDQQVVDPINPYKYLYDVEKVDFSVKQDGYYVINHIVLPTKKWYNTVYSSQPSDYKQEFEIIYVIDEDNQLYKIKEEYSEFELCDLDEVVERNTDGTSIERCVVDVFYTGFLYRCYIDYCKKLFKKLIKKCNFTCPSDDFEDLTYARDFLWMVLNVINYQIGFKQYMEAQRILESIDYCGGFCKNLKINGESNTGCGCTKNGLRY